MPNSSPYREVRSKNDTKLFKKIEELKALEGLLPSNPKMDAIKVKSREDMEMVTRRLREEYEKNLTDEELKNVTQLLIDLRKEANLVSITDEE